MKQAQIKELLNNGTHSKCVFHFVAENKKMVCLTCVERDLDLKFPPYNAGDQICVISGGDSIARAFIGMTDFYSLMLGRITLPNKLKLKEMIL